MQSEFKFSYTSAIQRKEVEPIVISKSPKTVPKCTSVADSVKWWMHGIPPKVAPLKDWTKAQILEYGSTYTHRKTIGILYQIYQKINKPFDEYLAMPINQARKAAPLDPLYDRNFK